MHKLLDTPLPTSADVDTVRARYASFTETSSLSKDSKINTATSFDAPQTAVTEKSAANLLSVSAASTQKQST